MDKQDLEATKAALLKTANNLITEYIDLTKVTSHAILGKAGITTAIINYCFGLKEDLIFDVFKSFNPRI